MEKILKKIVIVVFMVIVVGFSVLHFVSEDKKISAVERRRLRQVPKLEYASITNGEYFNDLDKYLLDQFPYRDFFRAIHSHFVLDVLRFKDNNDVYILNNHIMKLEKNIHEQQVKLATDKINSIIDSHKGIKKVYYSIIPDKNYYLLKDRDYPQMDYDRLFYLIKSGLEGIEYIDISSDLTIDDYYLTDSHFKQNCLFNVMNTFSNRMAFRYYGKEHYEEKSADGFLGVYGGYIGGYTKTEQIKYLTNVEIENSKVYNGEKKEYMKVYNIEDLNNMDPYDVFLAGAQPLIKIKNEKAEKRKLIIFRDSFGSSIAPLFINSFSDIILVDIRYMSAKMIDEYIDFDDAEVLFLYNTLVFNAGGILK